MSKTEAEQTTIELSIIEATKSPKQKKGEGAQAYLLRQSQALDGLSEADWAKLPEPTRNWHVAAAEAVNGGKPLPEFSAFVPEGERGPDATENPETAAPAPTPAPTTPTATAATTDGAKSAKTEFKGKKGGVRALRRIVVKNQAWTKDQILAALKAEGFEVSESTAASVIYDTKQMLDVIKEAGLLKA